MARWLYIWLVEWLNVCIAGWLNVGLAIELVGYLNINILLSFLYLFF